MLVQLDLTPAEIERMRAEIDQIPIRWAPTVIAKIATALPMVEENSTSSQAFRKFSTELAWIVENGQLVPIEPEETFI
jgi:hypothetical protein